MSNMVFGNRMCFFYRIYQLLLLFLVLRLICNWTSIGELVVDPIRDYLQIKVHSFAIGNTVLPDLSNSTVCSVTKDFNQSILRR